MGRDMMAESGIKMSRIGLLARELCSRVQVGRESANTRRFKCPDEVDERTWLEINNAGDTIGPKTGGVLLADPLPIPPFTPRTSAD
jgi:hypothetical protein